MENAAQVALVTLLALFIGYTLDSLNFIMLKWFQKLGTRPGSEKPPVLGLGREIYNSYKRIREQYAIYSETLWPHIMTIVNENNYAKLVEYEKAKLDFFLNLSLLSLVFVLECVITHVLGWRIMALVPWLGIGTSYVFYRLTIPCTKKWQDWIKAAFDLYRYQLAEALALPPFEDKDEEMQYWYSISMALGASEKEDEFIAFDYPLPKTKKDDETSPETAQTKLQIS
jgi:hypothetical protein